MSNQLTVLKEEFYAPIKSSFITQADEETFLREVNFAIQHFKSNQYLQGCDANTVRDAILNVSQTGLTLNPVLNYAYLVPRYNSKTKTLECKLDPSYQGLSKLATDTGSIISLEVNLLNENDEYKIDIASKEKIKSHVPHYLFGKPAGNWIGGYSLAEINGGTRHIEIMPEVEILKVRDYSESYKAFKEGKIKTCPWVSNLMEMKRKTIIKRHFKYLPKSRVPETLQRAIELDNQDYDFPMSYEQGNYIESLIINSAIPEQREREIMQAMANDSFTKSEAEEVITYLKDNQVDPISAGNHYSATDIVNKLDKDIN